jgi:hypothetical protein
MILRLRVTNRIQLQRKIRDRSDSDAPLLHYNAAGSTALCGPETVGYDTKNVTLAGEGTSQNLGIQAALMCRNHALNKSRQIIRFLAWLEY